jgi:hypothetical protein
MPDQPIPGQLTLPGTDPHREPGDPEVPA